VAQVVESLHKQAWGPDLKTHNTKKKKKKINWSKYQKVTQTMSWLELVLYKEKLKDHEHLRLKKTLL
jgi:hypothetical protein